MVAKDRHIGSRGRRIAGIVLAATALAAAYICIPRHPDLAKFDPHAMARLETAMWRHYYEKRYPALFGDLYDVGRREYGFSPLDSFRLALAAASAARSFQPSGSREEAEAALPALVDYFRILSDGAPAPIEVEDAARTELAWWQARREEVGPEEYGPIIARVATLVYGVEGADLRQSGLVRAQAMAYRDAHAANISEADWSFIAERLELAYGLLKKALSPPARG
ncbi:MAG TPA: hypothetical protein VIY51_27510 [Xanthobacteraceae bacterium]